MPPVVLNLKGVNEPCSTSIILCSYALFLDFSWWLKHAASENLWLDLAKGLNTFTSKNAFCPLVQKSLAAMSALASS